MVAKIWQHTMRDRLALRRIDLARHDGRARLVFGQCQLAQAAPRPACQPADVVGDFHQRRGERVIAPMANTSASCAASASNLFGRGDERQPGDCRDAFGDLLRRSRLVRVQAGAHRRSPHGPVRRAPAACFDASSAVLNLRRVARELLTERQRRGILCCVRPILTMSTNAFCFATSAARSLFNAGTSL